MTANKLNTMQAYPPGKILEINMKDNIRGSR